MYSIKIRKCDVTVNKRPNDEDVDNYRSFAFNNKQNTYNI